MKFVTLSNWAVVGSNPYMAPECQKLCLAGVVCGHSTINDWTEVVTSEIIGCVEDRVITYSGTQYRLLEAKFEYEKQFPNARARLFKSLKKLKKRKKKNESN